MSPSRRILLPLGGSLMSGVLYRRAVKLAKERNAELLIIRVTPRASSTRGNVDRVQRLLHALVTRSQRSGVPTRGLVLQGPMYEQIVQAARFHKPDVVVVRDTRALSRSGFQGMAGQLAKEGIQLLALGLPGNPGNPAPIKPKKRGKRPTRRV